MGRPRKRKCIESEDGVEAVKQADISQIPELNMAGFDFSLLDEDFGSLNDDPLFHGELFNDPYMFGQYQSNEVPSLEPQTTLLEGQQMEIGIQSGAPIATENGEIFHFGVAALPPDINFATSSDSGSSNDPKGGSLQPVNTPSPSAMDYGPLLSLQQENSISKDDNPVLCSCLASLYLALASLQDLPTDTTLAISTIRQAAWTAQTTMRCKQCGTCLITESSPPMKSLQNNMLIGTLLPVIADGYKRLLKMIDDRYTSACLTNSKISFNSGSYGGFKTVTGLTCDATLCPESLIEPAAWRAAMRALLRGDVYGIDEEYGGLKGLIKEMEGRQRRRHDELDRLRGEGLLPLVEEKMCLGERDRTCERILDLARDALEKLVIA